MVIDQKPQHHTPLPVGEKSQEKLQQWTHLRCGTTLSAPVEGIKNIECSGCGINVSIPPEGTDNHGSRRNRKKKPHHASFGNVHKVSPQKTGSQMTLNGGIVRAKQNVRGTKLETDAKIVMLKNKAAWKKMFDSFTEMYGVTYMSSPQYLLTLFEDQGFEKVELLIGHGLVQGYNQKLVGNETAIERMYNLVEQKSLTVYGTKATNHAKLYILKKLGLTRVVMGSPNLSYTAEGSRQREICVYWDIEDDNEAGQVILSQALNAYQSMLDESDRIVFMSDLQDQIIEGNSSDKVEQFQLWTRGKNNSESVAVRAIFDQIKGQAFNESNDESVPEIHITIPEIVKGSHKKYLTATLGAKVTGNRASIPVNRFLDHRIMNGTIPMDFNEKTGEIKFGIAGEIVPVTQEITDQEIAHGLENIEKFIGTVDRAVCAHPESVKMMLYETILFAFTAPFVNHLHSEKMRVAQIVNKRGPRHLLLYGPGGNGKTVIGRYLNFLLTGKHINPVSAKQWTKKQWENLFNHMQLAGSPYPVIIDDIKDTCFRGKRATLEGPVKSHWEENWKRNMKFPVMILNTNHEEIEEWAKSRIRRLELNVKHKGKAEDMKLLNDLMMRENRVFAAFAKGMTSQLAMGIDYSEDELELSRSILQNLYQQVGREIPPFFPLQAPEEVYDMDAISCYDKRKFGLIKEKKVKGGIRIEFGSYPALNSFKSRLPPEVNCIEQDKKLVITNPKAYRNFIIKGKPERKSIFRKRS